MNKLSLYLENILNEVYASKDIPCFEEPEANLAAFESKTEGKDPDEIIEVNGAKVKVYIYGFGEEFDYFFVHEDTKVGYDLEVTILIEKKESKVQIVCKNPKSKIRSFGKHIYVDYFVEKFGEIYSDDQQSSMGFRMWKRIFRYIEDLPQYKFFINDELGGVETELTDISEMDDYYVDDYDGTRFVVRKVSA